MKTMKTHLKVLIIGDKKHRKYYKQNYINIYIYIYI